MNISHFFVETGRHLFLLASLVHLHPGLAWPVRFVFLLLHLPSTWVIEKRRNACVHVIAKRNFILPISLCELWIIDYG